MSDSERTRLSGLAKQSEPALWITTRMAHVYYPILIEDPLVYSFIAKTFEKWDPNGVVDDLKINGKSVLRYEMKNEARARQMTEEIGGFVDPSIYRVEGGRIVFYDMWFKEHATPEKWHFLHDVLLIECKNDVKRFMEAFPHDTFEEMSFKKPRSIL